MRVAFCVQFCFLSRCLIDLATQPVRFLLKLGKPCCPGLELAVDLRKSAAQLCFEFAPVTQFLLRGCGLRAQVRQPTEHLILTGLGRLFGQPRPRADFIQRAGSLCQCRSEPNFLRSQVGQLGLRLINCLQLPCGFLSGLSGVQPGLLQFSLPQLCVSD